MKKLSLKKVNLTSLDKNKANTVKGGAKVTVGTCFCETDLCITVGNNCHVDLTDDCTGALCI